MDWRGDTEPPVWAVRGRASLIQDGWNSFCMSDVLLLLEAERRPGWNVSYPVFTTLITFQKNIRTASKLSIPKTCPQAQKLPFPVKPNLILNQSLCLHLAFKILVNFINTTDKLGEAQISTEINQVLQFWGKKKSCFVFWLVPKTTAPICHYDWERVTTICFYSSGKKNNILLSSSYS